MLTKILLPVAMALLLIPSAQAMLVSVTPTELLLEGDAPGTIKGNITVDNLNPFPVTVVGEPRGYLDGRVSGMEMSLGPGEGGTMELSIPVDSGGRHAGEVIFTFSSEGTHSAGISTLVVIEADGPTYSPMTGMVLEGAWIMGGLLFLVLLVSIYFRRVY